MKNRYKISTIINKTLVWVVVMMLSITSINAQTDLPDAPVDEPAAPIDNYFWVMVVIGLCYVYYKLSAFVKQTNTEVK